MTLATPEIDAPWLSLVGKLMDDLLEPAAATVASGTAVPDQAHAAAGDWGRAARWQTRFLFSSQEVRKRLMRANERLNRLPLHRRTASAGRLRAVLVSENPVSEKNDLRVRPPKRVQRFVAFLITELQRALGTSLEEAIEMTSTASRLTPDFGYISPSTLRSWYNKTGSDYRGMKQLASWLVAYWKRLAFNLIKETQRGMTPGYNVAETLAKSGVLTNAELASMRLMALNTLSALRRIVEAVAAAPVPNVNSGWKHVDIQRVSAKVLPILGLKCRESLELQDRES